MDIFTDVGFTLMGVMTPSPSKTVQHALGLSDDYLGLLTDIIFSENHRTPDSLIISLEKKFGCQINKAQAYEITDIWEKQFSDVYEIQGAVRFLENLAQLGLNIHIVSNIWFPFYDKFKIMFEDVSGCIKSETLSFQEGVRKPSRDFYIRAVERSGALPAQSIMVGDSVRNDIVPCAELGMKCIWFISRPLETQRLKSKRETLSKYDNIFEAGSLSEVQSVIEKIRDLGMDLGMDLGI